MLQKVADHGATNKIYACEVSRRDHLIRIKGGAFDGVSEKASPFGYLKGEGIDAGAGEPEWIVGKDRYKSDNIFDSLNPIDGKVTGAGKF
jgi:hypothetical protein